MLLVRFLCVFLSFAGICLGEGVEDEKLFRHMIGSWVGEGVLKNADGEDIVVSEKWTAKFDGEGTFVMEGERNLGDTDQEFRWRFLYNATIELYECHYWHTEMDDPLRFEVSLSDEKVELKTPFGEPGGELMVTNQIEEVAIKGAVQITDGNGIVVLSGELIHKKQD